MARVKIKKQEHYPFTTDLTIRVSDLNYGAHLGYDRVLTLSHQARMEMLAKWDLAETDLGDGKTGFVVADVGANYLGEGFLGDVLSVEIVPLDIGEVTFRLAYRFVNKKTGKDIALLEIGFVAFDYNERRLGRFPKGFIDRLSSLAS